MTDPMAAVARLARLARRTAGQLASYREMTPMPQDTLDYLREVREQVAAGQPPHRSMVLWKRHDVRNKRDVFEATCFSCGPLASGTHKHVLDCMAKEHEGGLR